MSDRFYYVCSDGHTWNAPFQFFVCPAFVQGVACPAAVRRVTAGGNDWKEKGEGTG